MTDPAPHRRPRVFAADDPAVVVPPPQVDTESDTPAPAAAGEIRYRPTAAEMQRGIAWGAYFLSAIAALTALAASLAFARFVSIAFERNDTIGWLAFGLLAIVGVSALVILIREIAGLVRLGRLKGLRTSITKAIDTKDRAAERKAVAALQAHFADRPDCRWALARLKDHAADVHDPGQLLALADRELVAPLDMEARRTIIKSAKRVATVTALSPMAWIAMIYVVIENLRMLRGLAALYGGRPGGMGALRLARMVVSHIVATGGVAMTDDLLGQFLGQDMLRRLSRRLGEGAFNGTLTARVGVAAIDVVRPLPFLEAKPVRLRDIVREVFRRTSEPAAADAKE